MASFPSRKIGSAGELFITADKDLFNARKIGGNQVAAIS